MMGGRAGWWGDGWDGWGMGGVVGGVGWDAGGMGVMVGGGIGGKARGLVGWLGGWWLDWIMASR